MMYLVTRLSLITIEAIVALTSIVCGTGMVAGVIQFPAVFLWGTPFRDYRIPGVAMAIVVGGSALLAAALLGTRRRSGVLASALAGLILLGFEIVEVITIDRNTGDLLPVVIALQAAYTVFGLAMLCGAAYLWIQVSRKPLSQRTSPYTDTTRSPAGARGLWHV